MYDDLLTTIYNNGENLINEVSSLLDQGANPNTITKYQESPLRVASNNGRFDVIKILLAKGADKDQLGWNSLFFSVVFGDLKNLEETVTSDVDLEHQDFWDRTPFLVAILVGDISKAELLLDAGANKYAFGRCGKPPLSYATQKDDVDMLSWLLNQGFDIEQTDHYSCTPLIEAAEGGAVRCVEKLIETGADIFTENHVGEQAISVASHPEIVQCLIAAGADINDLCRETRAEMLGYQVSKPPKTSMESYKAGKNRVFGNHNPQLSQNPFWLAMVKSGASAYQAATLFEKNRKCYNTDPVWCYDRFGMSITALPDGQFIEIAGEHEDHYDPDFCIYNDVFVHDSQGGCKIYTYPRNVFPPTDFHTATLIENQIYIIGNLGYMEDRRPGYTQVFILDIDTMIINRVETKGTIPGWISKHKAKLLNPTSIQVTEGKLIVNINGKEEYICNQENFILNVSTLTWEKTIEAR